MINWLVLFFSSLHISNCIIVYAYMYICITASLHLYSAQFQPGHLQFVNNILPLEEGGPFHFPNAKSRLE